MAEDVVVTEAVVVTGYGSQLQKEFTGAAATVDAAKIQALPVTSIDQALQGQAAGVQIMSASGTPGGGISVRVRGQTSVNAGNNPLYIIDGVQIFDGDNSRGTFDQGTNALAGINPQDIESMSVLKDASATAIYGARAANGVVIITTKRGSKSGKPEFSFNYTKGWSNPTNVIDVLNTKQFFEITNEANKNDDATPDDYVPLIPPDTDTDWLKQIFRTGQLEEYQLNVRGGKDATKFYISGGYRDEEGTMINSRFQRYTFRLNLDHQATKKLSLGSSVSFARTVNDRVPNDNDIRGFMTTACLLPSSLSIKNSEGKFTKGSGLLENPINVINSNSHFIFKELKILGALYAKYDFTNHLSLKLDFNANADLTEEDIFWDAETKWGGGGADSPKNGEGQYLTTQNKRVTFEPHISYVKTFNEAHSVSLAAGMTLQHTQANGSYVYGIGFPGGLTYLGSASQINDGDTYFNEYAWFSPIFSRLNYSYKEKYNFSASYRVDGSSRFGVGNRYGNFWAVSAGWIISDEEFMKQFDFLNMLKLRGSYGKTGNDKIGNYAWTSRWNGSGSYLNQPAIIPTQLENADLKWESTYMLDLGLEASFLDSRFNVNMGYYRSHTVDLLLTRPYASTTGFTGVISNIGESQNSGFELELRSVNLDMDNGFKWSTNLNIATNRNKILKLTDGFDKIGTGLLVLKVGEPMNSFQGLKFLGVDPNDGNCLYQDVNGDGKISVTDDQVILGNALPDFYGGFTNTFSYKGLQLDVFFQFTQGVNVYNWSNEFLMNPGANGGYNMSVGVLDRWQKPGDITNVPRATSSNRVDTNNDGVADNVLNNEASSRFIEDGSFIRLKNINLSYTLPTKIVDKFKLRSVRVNIGAQNLFTFTKYSGFDPEVSTYGGSNTASGLDFFTYPQSKMIVCGVNLGF